MTENPFKAELVTNPDLRDEGDWYVDDGIGVEYFWQKADADRYAAEVFASYQQETEETPA